MERSVIQEAEDRIRKMEHCLDVLRKAADTNPAEIREDASFRELLEMLTRYYESGLWLQDYELDEKGLLPQNLKRGVLAQDTLYDFLDQI